MKAVVVLLALLGVAAARPQFLYPANTQFITHKAVEGDQARVITTPFIYPHPTMYSTYPFTYPGLPYTHPFVYPVVANPGETPREGRTIFASESGSERTGSSGSSGGSGSHGGSGTATGSSGSLRSKRSADAEPEHKPEPRIVYTGIPFTSTTAYHYPAYPLVSTYGAFPNVPLTYTGFPNGPVTYGAFPNVPVTYAYPSVSMVTKPVVNLREPKTE